MFSEGTKCKLAPNVKAALFMRDVRLMWRRPESNRCPNIPVESFLHVYFRIDCREDAGTKHTNNFLRRIVLSPAHFVAGQHPLFVLSRRRHWKVANLCGGPNDYLITD